MPVLLRLLETTGSRRVRNAAAVGLRALGDTAAVPALVRQIKDPTNATNKGTLIYALQTLDARSAVVDLAQIMCGAGYEVTQMIMLVIEAFTGPPAEPDRLAAVRLLRRCQQERDLEDWQEAMIAEAIDLLQAHAAI